MSRRRAGLTLLELILVVSVLAIVSTVVTLAIPTRTTPPDDVPHRVADARVRALRSGRPVTVVLRLDSAYALATAMPDGRVHADSAARIDVLTGQPRTDSARSREVP